MLRVAAFIDAGYMWKQLWKVFRPDAADDEQFARSKIVLNYKAFHSAFLEYIATRFKDVPFLRCYWYDGPLSDGSLSADHKNIERLNDFKLRLGHRTSEKQKGVDGLIIADLTSLAQNKAISHALLISGDGDMVPGVGAAQSLGVRVHLLAIHSEFETSPTLRAEADYYELWDSSDIKAFAELKADDSLSNKDKELIQRNSETLIASSSDNDQSVARRLFEQLSDEEKFIITTASTVPYDIDRRLLRLGYEANGYKALEETQKRTLRAEFQMMAKQQ